MNNLKIIASTLFVLISSFIFCQTRSKAEAEKLAFEIYTQIQNGKSISTLATLFSDDIGSVSSQGKIKFNPGKKQLLQTFEDKIMKLEINQTLEPFETEFGYHIIHLVDKTDTLVQYQHILIAHRNSTRP